MAQMVMLYGRPTAAPVKQEWLGLVCGELYSSADGAAAPHLGRCLTFGADKNEKTLADFASEGLFRFGIKDLWWFRPIPS